MAQAQDRTVFIAQLIEWGKDRASEIRYTPSREAMEQFISEIEPIMNELLKEAQQRPAQQPGSPQATKQTRPAYPPPPQRTTAQEEKAEQAQPKTRHRKVTLMDIAKGLATHDEFGKEKELPA